MPVPQGVGQAGDDEAADRPGVVHGHAQVDLADQRVIYLSVRLCIKSNVNKQLSLAAFSGLLSLSVLQNGWRLWQEVLVATTDISKIDP